MYNVSETRIYIRNFCGCENDTIAIHVKKYIILQRVPVGRSVGGQRS